MEVNFKYCIIVILIYYMLYSGNIFLFYDNMFLYCICINLLNYIEQRNIMVIPI